MYNDGNIEEVEVDMALPVLPHRDPTSAQAMATLAGRHPRSLTRPPTGELPPSLLYI